MWQYSRFSDDVFMFSLRPNMPVHRLGEHVAVKEIEKALRADCLIDERITGKPTGPVNDPRCWRGIFTIGEVQFRIKAIYAFPKFFGLVADTEDGWHDSGAIQEWLAAVNGKAEG